MLKDEQAHVAAIDKLEQQRQKQVTDYIEAKGLASSDKTTVADVIEAAEQQAEKATLSAVRERLMQIINDLRKQNDLNQKLVFQSLQIVNLTLDAVRPRTEQMNYSSNEVRGTNTIAKNHISIHKHNKGGRKMRSTFMGLETSRSGLFTQQSALYTTGHNISNANTLGYSRQRVNMQATPGFPTAGLNTPQFPGLMGTGVEAGSVQRVRDGFIDRQYRQETNKLGYWESRSQAITQLEDVLNEPSEYGLAKSLDDFWKSLQDLSVNPENGGARSVVVQRGIAVADSFNYMHKSVKQIQENAGAEIAVSLKDVNSILKQIASINEQIKSVEPNGYMPNDLYDKRDILLDELSTHFPIETTNVPSGGNALAIAEGSVTVSLKLKDGSTVKLVDGKDFAQLRTFGSNTSADHMTPTGPVEGFYIVEVDADGNDTYLSNDWKGTAPTAPVKQDILNFSGVGKLKSLAESFGYISSNGDEKAFIQI